MNNLLHFIIISQIYLHFLLLIIIVTIDKANKLNHPPIYSGVFLEKKLFFFLYFNFIKGKCLVLITSRIIIIIRVFIELFINNFSFIFLGKWPMKNIFKKSQQVYNNFYFIFI